MGSRVETFEQIRRDRDREGLSIRALAERHGVHRRAVRQALVVAVPPAKRRPAGRPAPKLGPYRELIDSWLDADRDAPRKQRHTAKRIWERLREEHAADVAERTVREYVHDRRAERGEGVQAFVAQVHGAGVEAGVDWGEAQVAMAGSAARSTCFTCVRVILVRRSRWCSRTAPSKRSSRLTCTRLTGLVACLACCVMTISRVWSSRCCATAGVSRRTGLSRCARTIFMSRSSRPPGSRAPTKRVGSRERSGVSAAVTSSRSQMSARSGS